jgi:hypothetical protein
MRRRSDRLFLDTWSWNQLPKAMRNAVLGVCDSAVFRSELSRS